MEGQPNLEPLYLDAITPTLFFVQGAEGLRQGVDLTLRNAGAPRSAELLVRYQGQALRLDLGLLPPGACTPRVYLPDWREPTSVALTLVAQGQDQDHRELVWQPARHWEVFLVHGSHHDLGYTDLPSNLLREHDGFLDDVLRFCDETRDHPVESQFRYTVEQGWSVLHWMQNRPPDVVARMVDSMRAGRVEVTALLGNETTELCGSEEQIRLAYPAFRLQRRFGIPIRTAELNDIPGISWGLASVLAGSGVRYFAPAIPDYFAWGYKVHTFWDEQAVLPRDLPGAFWWEGPDGSRVLFWYGRGLDLWTTEQATQDIPARLSDLAQRGYAHDVIAFRFHGGHRDNSPADLRLSTMARAWNARWAYPRLVVSTHTQFFERFEAVAGAGLRVLRGDLPNTDYTVGATSTAQATGVNRLAHDALLSAEKLAACATLVSDYAYPAETLAEAYDSMLLYDEHTWGMAHPLGPAQEACTSQKGECAYRAAALAHDVLSKSTNRIADQVHLADEGYHLVVFNPLSRPRTDVVSVPAVAPAPCGRPMHWQHPPAGEPRPARLVAGTAYGRSLVDLPLALLDAPFDLLDLSTGQSVPYQLVTLDDPLAARPWAAQRVALSGDDKVGIRELIFDTAHARELLFLATDVPPLGYKTYRLVPGPASGTLACQPAVSLTQQASPPPTWRASVPLAPSDAADPPTRRASVPLAPSDAADPPTWRASVPLANPGHLSVGEHWIENAFYRVSLDPQTGAITSLYDKELRREWVDAGAPQGFNQLVVRSPKTGEVHAPAQSTVTIGERGPLRASLVVRGAGLGCPQRTQEIVLYAGMRRVELWNRLLRDATPQLEVYFAFPFAASKPAFRYEAPNAIIAPITDQLPGSNTDTYATQHWVALRDAGGSLTWSSLEAPVALLGGFWPGYLSQAHHAVTPPGYGHAFLSDPAQMAQGHIYSLAMLNNFRTNFSPVQVADVLFRYAITTHAPEWSAAQQGSQRDAGVPEWSAASLAAHRDAGWAACTPLVPVVITPEAQRAAAGESAAGLAAPWSAGGPGILSPAASFCQVNALNVHILTLKAAEDGDGLILRLAEVAGQDTLATVNLPYLSIDQALATNLVEEDSDVLTHDRHSVRVPLRAHGIATLRCRTARRWPVARDLARY